MRAGGQCENRQVGNTQGDCPSKGVSGPTGPLPLREFEIGVVKGALEGFGRGWVGGFAA